MRIIAGELRGRRLKAPRGRHVRPSADRLKESLFSILGERCAGARVLDLFAGTGALGLEAFSRGAASLVLVEKDPAVSRLIDENVRDLALEAFDQGRIRVVRAEGVRWLASVEPDSFDLVFLDPPYGEGLAAAALGVLAERSIVTGGGLVVVERSRREPPAAPRGPLGLVDERAYGDTILELFEATGVE